MQYQVLARKWRPRNFNELVGQEHVSRSLMNALRGGRLAHAFLFSGPRGSGKTTSARILAKALNCHVGKPGEPCSQCPACVEIAAGNCMDVLEIDAASNRGIDEIRELKEKVRYNPARDRNRIFIIDEVHMLTPEAFNALLKTLEEPPPRVVFILATTEHHKIPATILSRCQQYTFKLIPYPRILDRLREISLAEGIKISDGALEIVTFSSGGSMRDAMSALDQVLAFCGGEVRDEDAAALLGMVDANVLSRTVRAVAANNPAELLEVVADLTEAGQDLNNFCRRLSGQFRSLMVLKSGVTDTALLGVPESLLPELREQAELFSREELIRLFDTFQKIETGMKYAAQVRFQLEMGLIELAHAARLRPIEDLIAEFSACADTGAAAANPVPRPDKSAAPAGMPPAAPRAQRPAPMPPPVRQAPPAVSPPAAKNPLPVSAPTGAAGGLLMKIADAVGREPLRTLMQSFSGARLDGNRVVLEPGSANEFTRGRIRQDLEAISEAASAVTGAKVSVVIGESAGAPRTGTSEPARNSAASAPAESPKNDLLEKAKRDPVVRSFMDVFPGPISVEKIEK